MSTSKFIPLSVNFIETEKHGTVVKEFWIGDMMHSRISLDTYVQHFPHLQISLVHAVEFQGGGSLDTGMLDSVLQQLILQLNTGEKCGIISTPAMLAAFCELVEDFDILPDTYQLLEKYLISELVASRIP
jgi:hypothetical protein